MSKKDMKIDYYQIHKEHINFPNVFMVLQYV